MKLKEMKKRHDLTTQVRGVKSVIKNTKLELSQSPDNRAIQKRLHRILGVNNMLKSRLIKLG